MVRCYGHGGLVGQVDGLIRWQPENIDEQSGSDGHPIPLDDGTGQACCGFSVFTSVPTTRPFLLLSITMATPRASICSVRALLPIDGL